MMSTIATNHKNNPQCQQTVLNINPTISDPFYRYKMPAIECRTEGKGGNRNTKILNLDKVSLSLARPTTHITQWFKLQLKTPATSVDAHSRVYKLKGHIDTAKIQATLFDLITEWVLCPTCTNPETFILRSTAGTRLKVCCKACGGITRVRQRNYKGNIAYFKYLLNECPESSQESIGSPQNSTNGGTKGSKDSGDSMGLFSPRPDMPVTLSRCNSHEEPLPDDDEVEWSMDISPEAVAARQAEISRAIALADVIGNSGCDDDMNGSEVDADGKPMSPAAKKRYQMNKLCDLLDYTKSYWPLTPKDFHIKFVALSIDEKRACMVLPYLWRGDQIRKDLDKYMRLMEYMLVGKQDNQYYFLRELSRYVEILLEDKSYNNNDSPAITPIGICGLLSRLYEEDLIDDVSYHRWYNRGIGKNVRSPEFAERLKEYIQPFHEWIQQEDECDEVGASVDVDVVFDESANANQHQSEIAREDSDEEELDIDAI